MMAMTILSPNLNGSGPRPKRHLSDLSTFGVAGSQLENGLTAGERVTVAAASCRFSSVGSCVLQPQLTVLGAFRETVDRFGA
ncbi:Unannotated [Lentimonas sp. CC4]|nr:Unannotated [Lentimonas sp. CC4]CAA6687432.1 Unannotated [Lentimonas sp. CC6]CAA7075179.1 Unannotated [Lentimonas sp. CC4]CAA7172081.1 Unannotated [Lentimonas sp. CC21]CAA7180024.1 Unannotated [Lentimonas sp. CC8]